MKISLNSCLVLFYSMVMMLYVYTIHAAQAPWFDSQILLDKVKASLAAKEFDVNSFNMFGFTGLQFAVDKGNKDLVRLLIDAGADIHVKSRDQFGNTALHIATINMNDANNIDRMPLLEYLLEQEADPHARNNNEETPLHCLITVDKAETAFDPLNVLLAYGADINAQDNKGRTYLHNLVELRSSEMIGLLKKHYGFMLKEYLLDREGRTPLAWAELLRADEAGLKLKDPAFSYQEVDNVSLYDINGFTALMVAAMTNNVPKAQKFFDNKGDINKVSNNKMQFTALHYALAYKAIPIIRWLLDHNAKVDTLNAHGFTPAHLFVAMGSVDPKAKADHKDLLLSIIGKNPKILNFQNYEGDTIIHTLIKRNNSDMIATIAQRHPNIIDFSIRNNDLKTPLEIAEKLGDNTQIDSLKKIIYKQSGIVN